MESTVKHWQALVNRPLRNIFESFFLFNFEYKYKPGFLRLLNYQRHLFSVYIDEIATILRNRGVGCHYIKTFVACILFADDMALLAPSRGALQKMFNLCSDFCKKYC